MERDNFTCQICGNKDATLNVHHLYYCDEPWDAEDDCLITLCDVCHEHEHYKGYIYDNIQKIRNCGITTFEIKNLLETLWYFIESDPSLIVKIIDSIGNCTGCQVVSQRIYDALQNLSNRRLSVNKELWAETEK